MIGCAKSELALFDPIPVQTSIESASFVDYYPISDVTGNLAPIEFFIPSNNENYLDLNDTALYVRMKIVMPDGTSLKPNAAICPSNFALYSLFKDISLTLNETVIQGGDNLYSYRAAMNSLLFFDTSAKKTQMRGIGYVDNDTFGGVNAERKEWIADSKSLELYGPLHLDMFSQPKYLLPGVNIRLKLVRHEKGFPLFTKDSTLNKARLIIEQAVLYVRTVKCVPSVLQGHEIGLNTMNAIYPLQKQQMSTFTISQGQLSFNKENCLRGKMPKLVVVGFVSNAAFNGTLGLNSFEFKHYNLSYIGLFLGGQSVPFRQPLTLDFDNENYLKGFMSSIHALESYNQNESNGITLENFKKGHSLFVFNLTPDMAVGGGCTQPQTFGNLRLELKFKTSLPETINVLLYSVHDSVVEISKIRSVNVDI
jgi:hypothetical protein